MSKGSNRKMEPGLILSSGEDEFADIKRELRKLAPGGREIKFTRENVVRVVETVATVLGRAIDTRKALPNGHELALPHPVENLLLKLAGTIKDLEIGITDPVLRANAHGSNNSSSTSKLQTRQAWAESLLIVQRVHGLKSRWKAAEYFARRLEALGIYDERGRKITAKYLYNLQYRENKRG